MIGCEALQGLKKDCEETFELSREVKEANIKKNFFGILFEGLLRFLSPML
jgi:cardiolipin synthase